MSARALITGLGVAAPNGFGIHAYWAATLAGLAAIGPITRFNASAYPSRLAGEIRDFNASAYLPNRLLPQTDRMTQLALVSARDAVADAGLDLSTLGEYDVGVITASHAGGFEFGERELRALWSQGGQYVSAYQSFAWFYAVNSGQISIDQGLRGPAGVLVSDQAGGLDALAQARRQIRKGVPVILSGGVDASICSWGWVAQQAGGRLSRGSDPATAYLPFDDAADGHVPGEGGALIVVEDEEHARARGVERAYGEIAGHAATLDPPPEQGPPSGLADAIRLALDDAEAAPDDIDLVLADAAGLPDLDEQEVSAISAVFGPGGVPVTAPKTMIGRLYSGAAPLDVATGLLAIRDRVIPPTVGSRCSDRYDIDLVTSARSATSIRTVLVIARGQGGFNSALVLRAA